MELEKNLLSGIGQLLLDMKESVSVAESVTSGFLQFSFSQMPDASKFYKGGITAYTLEEKVKFLKVNKDEAESWDCVSEHIAEVMALHIAESFSTDWGIAVTGYATPVEKSDNKIFAYFSFSYKNAVIFTKKLDLHPRTEAENVQIYYSEFILGCFKTYLEQHKSDSI
ncbi:CinA family protein [Chryseobacterium indoltheticum]|uniref:Amidohydrolase, PncC family n=1 Tax=Chryseobacterium indoltheticum TaxID=254 RepID=A0A381FB07_9FLAO|nr:nicotinamide-nucleotide amidohydrolase family protein [Chryseobacterium indoltheticum]AZA73688.1 nicotinamide-nucleotide amidohydrolase family protein [Chryseobacterium indoltheticum]SIQ91683.1 amidohydrolase, PncC family [Chryseobacterium indoltheticum]SUX43766.1 competence damage-inducible protein A [Chryseobacterium indoltheticum]